MEYRWAVNKTKMLGLARQFMDVTVSPRKITYFKIPGEHAWRLDFNQDGSDHRFFLSQLGGAPALGHRVIRMDEDGRRREEYETLWLEFKALLALELLQVKVPQN